MVRIGDKMVGDGAPCFITFEAGPTHEGVESAKRLIRHAAAAGADAIKFQIFDPERLIADKELEFTYEVLADRETGETEQVSEPLYDIFRRRALGEAEWQDLKETADEYGLAFFATAGFDDEVDLIERLGCHSIKVASGDINHFPLIRRAARTGLCIQLDTGSAAIGEVEAAVDVIRREGNDAIIIHQCPSGYPARLESINLNIIPTLKTMFGYPAAYSDHTPGWEMDIAAVAMGANLVEKTITEDRMKRSVEHVMSLEPAEMGGFVNVIRELEVAKGSVRRILADEELEGRVKGRRSPYLKRDVAAGEPLSKEVVEFQRPGNGLPPEMLEDLAGRPFSRALPAGHRLALADLLLEGN